MNASDFISELADATKAQIAAVVAPLLERIAVLESQVAVPVDLDLVAAKAMRLVPPAQAGKDAPLPDLDVIALKAAALIPSPVNGKDADAALITSLQAEVLSLKAAVNAIPVVDVKATVAESVQKHVAALPAPKDGKDGLNGKDADPVDVEALALKAAALIDKPKDGRDGHDVDMPVLLKAISDAVAAQPKPRDGKDVDPAHVESLVVATVERVLATWERPADGASVTVDHVSPLVKSAVAAAVAEATAGVRSGADGVGVVGGFIDQDGTLHMTKSDGTAMVCGRVVGAPGRDADMSLLQKQISDELSQWPRPKDGEPGKDGQDGLGFDDMDGILDDEKGFVFRWARGERVKEKAVPLVLDRGVYRPGVLYRKGAAVTAQGSLWIAQADTRERPGDGSTSWRLAVKKGRDGRDAERTP